MFRRISDRLVYALGFQIPHAEAPPATGRALGDEHAMNKTTWIETLSLTPHPEGGYFRETMRADLVVRHDGASRAAATAIYFLLGVDDLSVLHRIDADEVWHFYHGNPIELIAIDLDGALHQLPLGTDLGRGELPQRTVPRGWWFGARMSKETADFDHSLVGCTVAPGFSFSGFEIGTRAALCQTFPQHQDVIAAFTRSSST